MKISVFKLVAILIISSSLTSCMKEIQPQPEKKTSTAMAKTTSELKVSNDFKWTTNNSILVEFKAVPKDVRVGTLKVVTPDGGIVFKKLQKASEDYSMQLTLPAQYAKVTVQFDGTSKVFDTKSGKVEMNLN